METVWYRFRRSRQALLIPNYGAGWPWTTYLEVGCSSHQLQMDVPFSRRCALRIEPPGSSTSSGPSANVPGSGETERLNHPSPTVHVAWFSACTILSLQSAEARWKTIDRLPKTVRLKTLFVVVEFNRDSKLSGERFTGSRAVQRPR